LNKYEGLFILDASAKEEVLKETIERIEKDIKQAGGRIATVQKMGPRPFARTAAKQQMGFYVNYVFEAPSKAIAELDAKLHLGTDAFRWQFTRFVEEPERKPRRKPETAVAGLGAARK
jgi:ribosomal protein S6